VVVVGFLTSLLNWFGVIHMATGGLIGDVRNTTELVPETPEVAPAEAPIEG
jgi:hypothetical protein